MKRFWILSLILAAATAAILAADIAKDTPLRDPGHARAPVSRPASDGRAGQTVAARPFCRWLTFLGGSCQAKALAVDGAGNIIVTGMARTSWGSPLNPFGGGYSDAFVAKLDANGKLLWHTYLGGTGQDRGEDIAADAQGNVFLTGHSNALWGTPILNQGTVFWAKLSADGRLFWHTFIGTGTAIESSEANKIAIDANGMPIGLVNDMLDCPQCPQLNSIRAQKLEFGADGRTLSQTDIDASGITVNGIGLDPWGNLFVTGSQYGSGEDAGEDVCFNFVFDRNGKELYWGAWEGYPISQGMSIAAGKSWQAYFTAVTVDGIRTTAYVCKTDLSIIEDLQWQCQLGTFVDLLYSPHPFHDPKFAIAIDAQENSYVSGLTTQTFGNPVHPPAAGIDAYVAKVDRNDKLLWNTFLGGDLDDYGDGVALGPHGEVYVLGTSRAAWGLPLAPYGGGLQSDAFLARLDERSGEAETPSLTVERRTTRAFTMSRIYGRVTFTAPAGAQAIQYRLLRKEGTGDYTLLKTIAPAELAGGRFELEDRYLKSGVSYTYLVEALDATGLAFARSTEQTI